MKFKIGEKVRLKHVTEEEKVTHVLSYLKTFKHYEGLTATIVHEYPKDKVYNINIHVPNDGRKPYYHNWNYHENWLEKLTTYDAF